MPRFSALVVLVAGLVLVGCGYSTTSRTAKDIKSVAVPFFENQTLEPDLEITVTESIIDDLIQDNTLKVTDEDFADAVLEGKILEFRNFPFSFDPELNAQEYHVVIKVEVTLFSRKLREPIWEKMKISGDGSYFIDAPAEQRTFDDAVDEAIKEITDRILNLTVQDW